MIFGSVPIEAAEGLVLAHSVQHAGGKLPKGHALSAADVAMLASAGIASVIGCRLEPGDLDENAAADILAAAIDPARLRVSPASTGRVNLHATGNGLFCADRAVVDRFNRVDPAITFACLADRSDIRAGDLVGTVKIIPLAVAGTSVEAAAAIFRAHAPVRLKPYEGRDVVLIATELPSLKPSVMDKTARVLEQRLTPSGSRIALEIRVAHDAGAVAEAISEALADTSARPRMIIVFGASAMSDPGDVIPEAIRLSGGMVEQVGLPVDPGNLLVLGRVGDVPVIGAPGCARSPKENGFDWVLQRLLVGEWPSAHDLTGLGVGGLLKEIPGRPLPREVAGGRASELGVTTIVLAAGRASRMGDTGHHKLLAEFQGEALVRRSARIAIEAGAGPVVVVTGHRRAEVTARLEGLSVTAVDNPDYATGMASSLKAGFGAPEARRADGVLVLLADMPGLTSADLERLISEFRRAGGTSIIRAASGGKRGNPVILPRAAFEAVQGLEGDIGARPIVEGSGLPVIDVDIGDAAHLDVDTAEAVVAAGGVLKG